MSQLLPQNAFTVSDCPNDFLDPPHLGDTRAGWVKKYSAAMLVGHQENCERLKHIIGISKGGYGSSI
jgi:hypothetical protein